MVSFLETITAKELLVLIFGLDFTAQAAQMRIAFEMIASVNRNILYRISRQSLCVTELDLFGLI